MQRRTFLAACVPAAFPFAYRGWGQTGARHSRLDASAAGQRVNLAAYGEAKSWVSSESSVASRAWLDDDPQTALKITDLPSKDSEVDLGVEWPEFRTIEQVVIRYTAEDKAPHRGRQILEYWNGLTTLQGSWKVMEDGAAVGTYLQVDGRTWIYTFPSRRTCKVRLRLQDQKNVEVEQFSVFGPSKWKVGELVVEWGHLGTSKQYDGSIETYNAELLELKPLTGATLQGAASWISQAGGGKVAGLTAKVLYTSGMDVDRSIITLRTKSGDVSFLPGAAIHEEPIDISDFGIYVCNSAAKKTRAEYLASNQGRTRIIDAVARHPEQTIEEAYHNIQTRRVTLSFVGVDSNSQKFGVAPDGHIVVGYGDPSFGKPITAKFAVYFETTEEPLLFQSPAINLPLAENSPFLESKHQSLEDGWLPIVTTTWSQNDLVFQRTDYAHLRQDSMDESKLMGNEPAVLVSRLVISNPSPVAKTGRYFIAPWRPTTGNTGYGPRPANGKNKWLTSLDDQCLMVTDSGEHSALCYIDVNGRGSLSISPELNAVRYSLEIGPGQQHTIHTVIPGSPLPARDASQLRGLPYERMLQAVAQYWRTLRDQTMQVELPEKHLQNIFDATQHHFLLAMTKDGKRHESYPNTAMFAYGSIGSESSPILQALNMRGMPDRVRDSLRSWLSTQGDLMPAGDYASKEGGFYRFWPNYTVNQGAVLWALAEHYFYTRDQAWLREVAPQIVAGCDFIIRERNRTKKQGANGKRPLSYGLAPAGCVADPHDWEYSFMLNGYFYLGLKKSAKVLEDVDAANAKRIAAEAADYLQALRRALNGSIAISPVTRLRDNTCVPSVPSYVGLRGFSTDVKDSVDPDRRHGYAYDATIGPFHLLKSEVLRPEDPEVGWMLNALEDRFFLFTPLPSRVNLDRLGSDWFNLGGFEKLQPYYVHYQDAYLQRDQIPNFLRGFYNTLASISDPQTLTFQEELDFGGGQPHKTHEEGWFFHQIRFMLLMEMEDDLHLARGVPRRWLEDGKQVTVRKAPSHFGEVGYQIRSRVNANRIEATVNPPSRNRPANLYLRLRHPKQSPMRRVSVNEKPWKDFDPVKEWIRLPSERGELHVAVEY
jgi:hypothetical protein